MRLKEEKGFSLLEIVIALLILIITGGLFINLGLRTMHQSYQDTIVNVVSGIAQGIQNYYKDIGSYPESLKDLEYSTNPNWAGKYIEFPLKDDNTVEIADGRIVIKYTRSFSGNTECGYLSNHPALIVKGTNNPSIVGLCKATSGSYTYYVLP